MSKTAGGSASGVRRRVDDDDIEGRAGPWLADDVSAARDWAGPKRVHPATIRHVLPGLGMLPRDLARDSVSGLVGSALGFARAARQDGRAVQAWGLASAAPGPDRYALDGVQMQGIRPWRIGRFGRVDVRYSAATGVLAAVSPPCAILHVHALPTLLLLPRARRRVLHVHMALGVASRTESLLVRRADAVVCASAYLAASFRQHHPSYPGTVHIVRNGADPALYTDVERGEAVRRKLGLSVDEAVVVFAGQVAPEKGIHHLIAAIGLLPVSLRPHLVVAGASTLWRSVDTMGQDALSPFERELRRRSVGLPIHWLGKVSVSAMPGVLLAADIVCCPSTVPEGLATINLEAAAAGKAVVASRLGGIPEVVRDGITGLLVPPGEPQALAGALARLIADPALRRRMGATARIGVHTWQQAAAAMREVYQRVQRP